MIDYTHLKLTVGKLYETKCGWYLNENLENYCQTFIGIEKAFIVLQYVGEFPEGNYAKYNVYKVLYNHNVYVVCMIPPSEKSSTISKLVKKLT